VYGNLADAMRGSLRQIRDFRRDVDRLRKEGLSPALVRQLLAEGPTAGLPQAEQMLHGGRAYIRELSRLESEITKASQHLGASGAQDVFGKRFRADLEAGLGRDFREVASAIRHGRSETTVNLKIDVPVKVAGKTVARVNQTFTLRRAGRNISSGLKLGNRGA